MNHLSIRLLLAVFTLGFLPATHAATKLIAKLPFTINAPGSYALAKDLKLPGTSPATAGITINADNVTIDLRGFSLTGDATASAANDIAGIFANGHNHLTIRNGTIRNFARGVIVDGDATNTNDVIEDLTVLDCSYIGIQVGAAQSVIRRNRVVGVGGATFLTNFSYGMYLRCAASRISDNDVSNILTGPAYRYGIFVDHGRGTVLENNRVLNTEAHFSLTASAGYGLNVTEFATLDHNVSSHFGSGFKMDNCATVFYRDNTTARVALPYEKNGNTALQDGGGNL